MCFCQKKKSYFKCPYFEHFKHCVLLYNSASYFLISRESEWWSLPINLKKYSCIWFSASKTGFRWGKPCLCYSLTTMLFRCTLARGYSECRQPQAKPVHYSKITPPAQLLVLGTFPFGSRPWLSHLLLQLDQAVLHARQRLLAVLWFPLQRLIPVINETSQT